MCPWGADLGGLAGIQAQFPDTTRLSVTVGADTMQARHRCKFFGGAYVEAANLVVTAVMASSSC